MNPDDIDPERWREHALCRGTNVQLFYPEKWDGEATARAVEVCQPCPVREHCLDEALSNREPGIWGGMSERQRRIMQARTGKRPYERPIIHGTEAGYRAHRRRQVPICEPCRQANALAGALRKAERDTR